MSENLSVKGNLRVAWIEGRRGPFPIGTLSSSVGQFTVRDSWLESLEAGYYDGCFIIENIQLYSYPAFGEVRTSIRAFISSYQLFTIDQETGELVEADQLPPDPIDEELDEQTLETFTRQDHSEAEDVEAEAEVDEAELEAHVELLMANVNGSSWWELGDNYKIDTTIGRASIIKCKAALNALGYTFDPLTQTYSLSEVEA